MDGNERIDRQVRWGGIITAIVILVAIVSVFVLAKNTPRGASDSYNDGYQTSLFALPLPAQPTLGQLKRSCEYQFTNALSSNQASDRRAPFVQGCVNGIRHRVGKPADHH
jgi:hypothetical protein